jgi:DNA-binding FadR family transcriptional regulator
VGERRDEARALTLPRPAPRRGERRADRLTEALKHYILTNRLPPGSRLPPAQ